MNEKESPLLELKERFHTRTVVIEDCLVWIGSSCRRRGTNNSSYGQLSVDGKLRLATHVSWFIATGQWPTKNVLHKNECKRAPLCVKFDHLYEGSQQQNMFDREEKRLSSGPIYCTHGHLMDEENTRLRIRKRNGRIKRECRKCHKEWRKKK